MLATIHDMTHEMCSTCITPPHIRKDGIIQTSPVVAIEKVKGPTHMVEGGNNLKNWYLVPTNLRHGGKTSLEVQLLLHSLLFT